MRSELSGIFSNSLSANFPAANFICKAEEDVKRLCTYDTVI